MSAARKPRMPESLRVGPIVYDVQGDSLAQILAERERGHGLLGLTDPKALTIMVAPDQAELAKKSTMVHEALHAVINTVGLEITDEDEERLVRILEAPLLALIRDNPELISWLSSD